MHAIIHIGQATKMTSKEKLSFGQTVESSDMRKGLASVHNLAGQYGEVAFIPP